MDQRLAGKVAIITGSTSGIGRSSAELFAEHGARVVVNGRRKELGREVVAVIEAAGGEAIYVPGDVKQPEVLQELVSQCMDRFGRIDILMNNAWTGTNRSLSDLEPEDWDESFALIVKAAALGSKYALPHMIAGGGGAIINVSSVHGVLASRSFLPYDAMKAALVNLTRQMAVDYGQYGIRVNALCPGRIITERSSARIATQPEQEVLQTLVYPLGRPGTMREAAYAALFLASDEASFVTGHALLVDGGLTAQLADSVGAHVERSLRAMDEQDGQD